MDKKKIIRISDIGLAVLMTLMIGLTACSKKENNEPKIEDIKENMTIIKETDTTIEPTTKITIETITETVEPEYEEKGNIFLITSSIMYGDEYVDGQNILSEEERANYSNPVWQDITITGELTLYNICKYSVGYTKSNFDAILIQTYGEWTYIDVLGGADTSYAVRTDDLNKAMVVKEKETESIYIEPETEKTYTIEEEFVNESYLSDSEITSNNTESTTEGDNTGEKQTSEPSVLKQCTPEEMVDMLKKAFEEQGFMFYPDYEELFLFTYDTTYINPVFSYEKALTYAKEYKNRGFNLCWVEYERTNSDGTYAIKIYRGTRPEYVRTPEEVIDMLDKAFKEAGCVKSTDRMSPEDIEKYGPQDGMGWGLSGIEPDYTYEDALNDAKISLGMGYNIYYLEYVETHMDGTVVIKVYRGSTY